MGVALDRKRRNVEQLERPELGNPYHGTLPASGSATGREGCSARISSALARGHTEVRGRVAHPMPAASLRARSRCVVGATMLAMTEQVFSAGCPPCGGQSQLGRAR